MPPSSQDSMFPLPPPGTRVDQHPGLLAVPCRLAGEAKSGRVRVRGTCWRGLFVSTKRFPSFSKNGACSKRPRMSHQAPGQALGSAESGPDPPSQRRSTTRPSGLETDRWVLQDPKQLGPSTGSNLQTPLRGDQGLGGADPLPWGQ